MEAGTAVKAVSGGAGPKGGTPSPSLPPPPPSAPRPGSAGAATPPRREGAAATVPAPARLPDASAEWSTDGEEADEGDEALGAVSVLGRSGDEGGEEWLEEEDDEEEGPRPAVPLPACGLDDDGLASAAFLVLLGEWRDTCLMAA